jgi:hypothetical protein
MMSTGGTVPLLLTVATSPAAVLQSICRELVSILSVQVDRDPITSHHASSVQTSFNTPCKSKKIPAHAGTHHMMSTGGTSSVDRSNESSSSPAEYLQRTCRVCTSGRDPITSHHASVQASFNTLQIQEDPSTRSTSWKLKLTRNCPFPQPSYE